MPRVGAIQADESNIRWRRCSSLGEYFSFVVEALIDTYLFVRQRAVSVQAMMRLLGFLNVLQISLNASIFIPRRSRCPL